MHRVWLAVFKQSMACHTPVTHAEFVFIVAVQPTRDVSDCMRSGVADTKWPQLSMVDSSTVKHYEFSCDISSCGCDGLQVRDT
jgi:hypothetical protein